MAIDSNSLTLSQYLLQANEPAVRALVWSLIENGMVAQDIPIITDPTLKVNGTRIDGNLASVSWVPLNNEGVVTSSTTKPYSEQAYILRNYLDTDHLLTKDKNAIVDPRQIQLEAFLKAQAYDFNDKFINNNHTSGDKNSFVGIRARLDDASATPSLFGLRSRNKIDAGAVDCRKANATQATANILLDWLSQLLDYVGSPDGSNVVLYMNDDMKRRVAFLLRLMGTSGGYNTTKDQFDRTVETFRNAVIRDVGLKADQSTKIITNLEASDGTTATPATYTSIYAVKYGVGKGLYGWQMEPLVPTYPQQPNGVILRTMIEWAFGICTDTTGPIGRLFGIKMA